MKFAGISQWGNQKKLLIYSGILGVAAMALFFLGVHYISVGSAVTLRYVSPIFAGVLAVLFLKETIKPLQWVFFLVAFLFCNKNIYLDHSSIAFLFILT